MRVQVIPNKNLAVQYVLRISNVRVESSLIDAQDIPVVGLDRLTMRMC